MSQGSFYRGRPWSALLSLGGGPFLLSFFRVPHPAPLRMRVSPASTPLCHPDRGVRLFPRSRGVNVDHEVEGPSQYVNVSQPTGTIAAPRPQPRRGDTPPMLAFYFLRG